ncbi:hypothetical protein AVEN_75814-1 [Araneus ventricosus]|uniref:Uncharacterized protein n=1 Tax=Araneus ventricosus TaxID=182803 RepID=A0A4Y2D212_ARAVE|nr:hypothetical protein AVEN_15530-1 [Araneus ventricosus]GBM10721.1 hypothetical protein AVEN_75814-1 [Araneus ventricosus]
MLMNYMREVGKIMGGSDLERYEVFVKNPVVHIANGHAYTRALRSHSRSQVAIVHLIWDYCEEDVFLVGPDDETLRGNHDEVINMSPSKESLLS